MSSSTTTTTTNKTVPTTAWQQNFLKLKEFKEQNGHCDVPFSGNKRYLAKWVGRQKTSKSLSKEQKQKLKSISFDWRTKKEKDDDGWDDSLNRLINYGALHGGDYNVPQKYNDDLELGTWVANQRKLYHRGKMREDRKEKLKNLGFMWKINNNGGEVETTTTRRRKTDIHNSAYQKQWNAMFQRLKEYKLVNGNCNVPYNFIQDKTLGMWVSTQRRVYRKKTYMYGDEKEMCQYRKDMLKSIGFEFDDTEEMTKSNNHSEEENEGKETDKTITASKDGGGTNAMHQQDSDSDDYKVYHI